ncbi:MAG: hypothetical protein AAF411_12810 [Myxococcota bacterium]
MAQDAPPSGDETDGEVVSAGNEADGGDDTARDLFELGQRLYSRGEFVAAAEAFERSYEESHRPELLYNVYLARRDAGAPAVAASALRRYLREADSERLAETRDVLEARAASLEAQAARDSDAQAPQEPDASAGRSPAIGPVVLISAGGAAILAGAIMGVLALGKQSDLDDVCGDDQVCPASAADDITQGRRFARASDGLLFGGLAVAAGGALWWILGSRGGDDGVAAGAACSADGCTASLGRRF